MIKRSVLCLAICPLFAFAQTEWECELPPDFSIDNPFHYIGVIDGVPDPVIFTMSISLTNNLSTTVSTATNISSENANKVKQILLQNIYIDTIVRLSEGDSPGGAKAEFHMVGNPNSILRLNTIQYPPVSMYPFDLTFLSNGDDEVYPNLNIRSPISLQNFVTFRGGPMVSEYKKIIKFMTPDYTDNEYGTSYLNINATNTTFTNFSGRGLGTRTFNDVASSTIVCKSIPVPLNLSLTPDVISFGAITLGDTVPTTRELRWTTTGSGKANIWSVRFESANIVNNKLMLGGATVSITGKNDQEIPVNTDVAIEGTSGTFNFHLDPSNGTINDHETAVNVVLTAN